jgi:hypothetical protein
MMILTRDISVSTPIRTKIADMVQRKESENLTQEALMSARGRGQAEAMTNKLIMRAMSNGASVAEWSSVE